MKNSKLAQNDCQYLKHPLYHHGCHHPQQPQQHQAYQYPQLHNVEHIKLQQQQSQMLMTKPFSPAYVRIEKDGGMFQKVNEINFNHNINN